MLSRDFVNKKLTEGQIRQTPCELEVVCRYRIDYNIIYRDFKDDCYEQGWSTEELRDACDSALEGYRELELGLD